MLAATLPVTKHCGFTEALRPATARGILRYGTRLWPPCSLPQRPVWSWSLDRFGAGVASVAGRSSSSQRFLLIVLSQDTGRMPYLMPQIVEGLHADSLTSDRTSTHHGPPCGVTNSASGDVRPDTTPEMAARLTPSTFRWKGVIAESGATC